MQLPTCVWLQHPSAAPDPCWEHLSNAGAPPAPLIPSSSSPAPRPRSLPAVGTWCPGDVVSVGTWPLAQAQRLCGQGGPQHPAEPCPPHVLLSLQDRRTARSCSGAGKRGPCVLLPSPAAALCHRPAPPASSACNEGFPWQPYLSVASDTDVNFKMKYSDHSATSINKPQCMANSPST